MTGGGTPRRPVRAVPVPWSDTCPVHGKRTYRSRKRAKQAIRQSNERGMREYRCDPQHADAWHIGHMPQAVRLGLTSRNEYYETKGCSKP